MNYRILFVLMLPVVLFSFRSRENALFMTGERKMAIRNYRKLVINCPVTMILVQTFKTDTVWLYGEPDLLDKIIFRQTGGRLVINAKTTRDLKNKVTIHIPLHFLEKLEINSPASVMSVTTILAERPEVKVNGSCTLDIAVNGKLVINESGYYNFTYRRVYTDAPTVLEKK